MSLYVSEKVGNEIVLKKYAPAVPVYRGFWAVTIGGFAGTLVECNGSMRYIGSNEKTIYQIVEPGTYTFTATRHGETKSKTIVLNDKDPNNSYTVNLGLYIGMQYLEYIESTGTQYIDTGISGNNDNLKIECEFIITEIPRDWSNIYGNYVDENSNSFRLVINGNSHNGFFTSNTQTGQGQIGYNFQTDTKYTIESSYLKSIINNTTYNYSQKIIGDENNTTILLFNSSTISGFLGTPIKLYSFKIYDNDVLVSDMIPIKDDTGHGAMYDKITQQIFYNSGTGEFICGPNKPYTRIQYLEGICNEQYIDLGIIPTPNLYYYGKFGFQSVISGSYEFFGARDTMGSGLLTYTTTSDNNIGVDFFRTSSERYVINNVNPVVNDIFVFDIQNKIMKISKNGSVIDTHTFTDDGTTTETLYLNGTHSTNAPTSGRGIGRIYAFKIWDNGTLLRDMIPILDNEDVPCMYDRVNDRLYYNNGTGEFRPGIDYLELEYIQNSGSQKIDTGVTINASKRFEIDVRLNSDNPNENSIMGTGDSSDTNLVSIRAGNYFGAESGLQNHFGFIKNQKYYFPGEITKDTNRHLFVIDLKNNKVKIDQYEAITDGTTNSSLTWWIGSYMGNTSSGFDWIGKYYGVKIYNNEELIHDLIPVQRISDNEVCFYDTITGEYFVNSGTEDWIPGPVKQ